MSSEWMPRRGSLVAECLRVMRLRIEAGEWTQYLPGERRLADQLQVGRDTVRLALAELENSGWISDSEAGRRRRILKKNAANNGIRGDSGLRVGMLSPHRLEQMRQPVLLEVDQIRRALAANNGTIEVYAPNWFDSSNPEKRLEELIENERRTVWILYRANREVQTWFASQRIPCLVRGTSSETISLPFLDVDWEATARHAAGQLWRLGHRRVGIMTPPDPLSGVEAAVRGAHRLNEREFKVIDIPENGTAHNLSNNFARAMKLADPPTAIIATRSRQIATLIGCAGLAGLRIPEHLSLISLAREPFLEYLVPDITSYHIDPAAVAKQVVRRLAQLASGNLKPAGNPWLEPELIKGASVGPPSKT